MQIIVPMTGYGSRFVGAGYVDLKPLIRVNGFPMIEWIVKGIFPGEAVFLFICRKDHLDSIPDLEDTLKRIAPRGRIVAIEDWKKLGPVNDVLKVADWIDDREPAVISYCDYYMSWDWATFKKEVLDLGYEGAIPCYTGFHPHLLPTTNLYASCKKSRDELLLEIREKHSFEVDKSQASHSPGLYYFGSGRLLKHYCSRLITDGSSLLGEYYVSLVYNNMVKDGLRVWVPDNIISFCQWGTPEDLQEFEFWNNTIRGWKP